MRPRSYRYKIIIIDVVVGVVYYRPVRKDWNGQYRECADLTDMLHRRGWLAVWRFAKRNCAGVMKAHLP